MNLRGNLKKLSGGLVWTGLATLGIGVGQAAVFVIEDSPGIFAPTFRGIAGSTYVAWNSGSWDGNDDPGADIVQSSPPINPEAVQGVSLVQNHAEIDIVSGSNNIYTSVPNVDLTLTLATNGVVGSAGFTTIIIQGSGLSGNLFGFTDALDGFGFGAIAGVLPDYEIGRNADGEGQWWAKWVIPGNQPTYEVAVFGQLGSATGSVVSVTDMSIDTWYSADGWSDDMAVVPEPSAVALGAAALLVLVGRRRRVS